MCIYCDYCVYHYKSTELVSLYTLEDSFPRCHTYNFDKSLVVLWSMVNFPDNDINVRCVSTTVCLTQF